MKYITYIHLNSGSTQRMEPDGADDTIVAMARNWLDADGLHKGFLPGLPLDMVTTRTGMTVFCTIQVSGRPLVEFAIAKRSIGSPQAWADLHEKRTIELSTSAGDPPPAPWLGIIFLPALRQHPQSVALAAIAAAKCCAYALIETGPRHDRL